jgi:hypothetical protein
VGGPECLLLRMACEAFLARAPVQGKAGASLQLFGDFVDWRFFAAENLRLTIPLA